ncbi:MAG: hypothetical protein ACW98K_10240 [Candidatus Kariarchaeaceae archaeon]|jgi:hypothetical protein
MARPSVIKLPNGTVIEVSSELTPDQITALVTAVNASGMSSPSQPVAKEEISGQTIVRQRTAEEIWNGSKRDRVALFIRNYISEHLWFDAKEILDQQLTVNPTIILGESPAIATYLNRLFDMGYLDREKSGRNVKYRVTLKLQEEYPEIARNEMEKLVQLIH